MAITSAICTSFKVELLKGVHNFTATTGNTFKIALYDSDATLRCINNCIFNIGRNYKHIWNSIHFWWRYINKRNSSGIKHNCSL